MPKRDLYIRVSNSTGQSIEVCYRTQTYCIPIADGNVDVDAQPTDGKQDQIFDAWMDFRVARICQKVIPLRSLVEVTARSEARGVVTYSLNVTSDAYSRHCASAAK